MINTGESVRIWVSRTDVAPLATVPGDWGPPKYTTNLMDFITVPDGPDAARGGVFLRCDGNVWFYYSVIGPLNAGNQTIHVKVASAPETGSAPREWSSWTEYGTVITFYGVTTSNIIVNDHISGSFYWQTNGGGVLGSCLQDNTIVLSALDLNSIFSGRARVAWKHPTDSSWTTPSTNPVTANERAVNGNHLMLSGGPWVIIARNPGGSDSILYLDYAHSTNLNVWTEKSIDLAEMGGGCTGTYHVWESTCNSTHCFFPFSCSESGIAPNCRAKFIRILTLTLGSCGANGFSQEGDHCVFGEVSNCQSNCKCGAGFQYSHTSAFGGCVATGSPIVMNPLPAPGVAPPVATPVASPVDVPVSTPVSTPVASPVAVPAEAPISPPEATPIASPTAGPINAPFVTPSAVPQASPSSTSPPVQSPLEPAPAGQQAPLNVPTASSPSISPTALGPTQPQVATFIWRLNVTTPVPSVPQTRFLEASIASLLNVSTVSLVFTNNYRRSVQALLSADLFVPNQATLDRITANATLQAQIGSLVSDYLNGPAGTAPTNTIVPTQSNNINRGDGIGTGGIIGIAVAVVVAVLIAVILVVVLVLRNKKKKGGDEGKTKSPVVETEKPKGKPQTEEPVAKKTKKAKPSPVETYSEEGDIYGEISTAPAETAQKEFRDEWIIAKEDLEFGDRIGKGSFGTVFSGTYGGSHVAIKQCSLSLEPEALEEFKREAIFMLGLKRHPSIVSVLGVCIDVDQIFVIMEYCDSGSLDKLLSKLSLTQKLQVLDDVAKGIAHLHRCGVVHRDLAARNVLLTEKKNGFQAKVADFGMSRMVDKFEQQGVTNAAIGPVKYMAPESLAKKIYSPASDTWTFGILCYEVLSETPPHANVDLFTAGLRIRDDGLTPVLPENTPEWLRTICSRCWSIKSSQRPSMDGIVKEFKKHVEQTAKRSSETGSNYGNSIQSGSVLLPPISTPVGTKQTNSSSESPSSCSSSSTESESNSDIEDDGEEEGEEEDGSDSDSE